MTEEEKQAVINEFILERVNEIEDVAPAVARWLMEYFK